MPFRNFPNQDTAPIDEKISKLSDFICRDIEERKAHRSSTAGGCYLLIARSPDSPVAQALLSLAPQLAAAGATLRTVFCEGHPEAETIPLTFPGECRIARDARLLAAHEQLVLGPTRTWIGDSMRREPTKRDAFERFVMDCQQTARMAIHSFERLWQAAAPVETTPPLAGTLASQMPEIAGVARHGTPSRQ